MSPGFLFLFVFFGGAELIFQLLSRGEGEKKIIHVNEMNCKIINEEEEEDKNQALYPHPPILQVGLNLVIYEETLEYPFPRWKASFLYYSQRGERHTQSRKEFAHFQADFAFFCQRWSVSNPEGSSAFQLP